jgi:hypothetical protein
MSVTLSPSTPLSALPRLVHNTANRVVVARICRGNPNKVYSETRGRPDLFTPVERLTGQGRGPET